MAGLVAARKRGKKSGRPLTINAEKMDSINEALKSGMSKAAICRNFAIKRSTLYDALARNGLPQESPEQQSKV